MAEAEFFRTGSPNPGLTAEPDDEYTPYSMTQLDTEGVAEQRARRKLPKAALREEIMNAAAELFAAEGYGSVSMRKIAQRIGYTPMSIYLHFNDKDDLLDCICEQAFVDLYKRHERVDREISDPGERLQAGMRTFIDFALQNPSYYRATFIRRGEAMPRRDRIRVRTAALKRQQVAAFLGPEAPEDEIEVATQVVMVAENGVATMLTANPKRWVEPNKLIAAVTKTIAKGLRD
jgi:AcrR family transcriptional regulator